jgi:delta14-sterol reductase
VRELAGATAGYVGFLAVLFVGARFLPGKRVLGQPEPDGTRYRYTINGPVLFWATNLAVALGTWCAGLSLASLIVHFRALFIAANLVAFTVTVLLYLKGRSAERGSALKAAFYGTELNPRWLGVDLKMFAYEPSLIGLWLLVAAFAYLQHERHGFVTARMWLFQGFWWLYLVTHYRYEEFMLQTWDVIAERFGWGLVWGDLVLVPFFYSIGGWYLVDDLAPISAPAALAITALYLLGLWIFRGANAQKHRFKMDAGAVIWGNPAETLGGRLLVSGFWGIGRHLNYTGEILVYLSFALTTGFQSVVPYLLPLWMCALLAHRAERDDRRCRAKYGPLWHAYCTRARFRMLPGVY